MEEKRMVGPSCPLIVLFGSSIVQLSYFLNGWGATLTTSYACKDRHKEIQPSLVILYFDGNDSQDPDFPNSSRVPLHEYVENKRKLAHHIKGFSDKTRLIMLSVSAVNEELILKTYGDGMHLTVQESKILFDKIKDVIKKADWEPTLDWDKMPTEYADIGIDMHLEMMIKETEDATIGITDSDSQDLKPQ
ncbi:hypothetical protein T459_27148 [Capsicum annuum]|uniref:SGNH hydrolase-type esterase domain-containing protein n=1 Tax=Capsicum annuum TaxID=4072 RepID=A0A2G2YDM4_CAPAN|nr:hypothetical protein T459_27148 [Capsicum annuum]